MIKRIVQPLGDRSLATGLRRYNKIKKSVIPTPPILYQSTKSQNKRIVHPQYRHSNATLPIDYTDLLLLILLLFISQQPQYPISQSQISE